MVKKPYYLCTETPKRGLIFFLQVVKQPMNNTEEAKIDEKIFNAQLVFESPELWQRKRTTAVAGDDDGHRKPNRILRKKGWYVKTVLKWWGGV